jgi:arylsulfatase A-like enzyme
VGTALAAVGGWRFARASAPVSGPIILLSIDSLRADRLPIYGYTGVKTPALDALARDGVVFERAYSHAPQTLPAHASLLSGRLPFDTGVRDNLGFRIAPRERLIAEMLRDRGYATGGIVSSYVLRRDTGIAQGFSFFDDDLPGRADSVFGAVQRDGVESVLVAENWLGSIDTTRAFLFLHLYDPHAARRTSPEAAAGDPYDAEVASVDEVIGRFVRYLKSHQLYDQSTIIVVSDHGEGLGDHGEQGHGLFVYEEAVRVPLIVKQAAGEAAGRRVPNPVQHVDIVPTILDLARAPVPDNLRGRSLKPLLEGRDDFDDQRIYSESLYALYHFGASQLTSLTDGRYRYIAAPREELYDLRADPAQRDNIAESNPRTATSMREELEQLVGDAAPPPAADVTGPERDRLQSLGYVGMRLAAPTTAAAERPDPKDLLPLVETYRTAFEHARAHEWRAAIDALRTLTGPADTPAAAATTRADVQAADAWRQIGEFAQLSGRSEMGLDAYRRAATLAPGPLPHLAAADLLLRLRRLDEAAKHAAEAIRMSADDDAPRLAEAHAVLARIAVARGDADTARREAGRAEAADASRPIRAFIEGRLLQDQGEFTAAAAQLEHAIEAIEEADAPPMRDLHHSYAEVLGELQRTADAERQLLLELAAFPDHVRARGTLAAIYQATDRTELAAAAVEDITRFAPTAEGYAAAARLWTSFGNPAAAAAVRAEARRSLPSGVPPVASASQQ